MRSLIALLLVGAFALSACGDDSGTDDAAPAETATGTVTIDIAEFRFDPRQIEVPAGAEIVWENVDDFAHTARADDGAFDTGDIAPGASSEPVVLDAPGTYSYVCAIHNSMTGTVTVTG